MHDHVSPNPSTIERLEERVARLRPWLREQQQACEQRGHPSKEVYLAFKAEGLFKVLTPRMFGGFEMTLEDFYRVVIAIARGCPSTGWWYALGAGHTAQIASYCSPEAQERVYAADPDFSAPWTFNSSNAKVSQQGDGYRVSGTWRFASGAPHASFFMAGLTSVDGYPPGARVTALIPRGDFEVLDDWGDVLGVRGSGSNSVRIEDVFVPGCMMFQADTADHTIGNTPGSQMHRNPLYGGLFRGFAEGGLAAVSVGIGLAALDEYADIITTKPPFHRRDILRAADPDFQRTLGLALVNIESARAVTLSGARLYLDHSQQAVSGQAAFDLLKAQSLDGMYHTAERLAFEAVQSLARSSSTSALRDGQKMQRYLRDVITMTSRNDYFEFRAADLGQLWLRQQSSSVASIQ